MAQHGGIMATCSIEGCERLYYAKGYCQAHYTRFRNTGTTNPLTPIGISAGERAGSIHVPLDEQSRSLIIALARKEGRRINEQASIVIRRGLGLPDFEDDES